MRKGKGLFDVLVSLDKKANFWATAVLASSVVAAPFIRPSPVHATTMIAPTFSSSGWAFATSNSDTDESMGDNGYGPQESSDGYVGTFSYSYDTSAGLGNVETAVVYQVFSWDSGSSSWTIYDAGCWTETYGAEESGTETYDFYAGSGLPTGPYMINAWVCVGNTSDIAEVQGGSNGAYAFVSAYDDDPLPDPEPSPGPYPGGEPPITHPELPPTGPVGPGPS